jgi:hypothetical protein
MTPLNVSVDAEINRIKNLDGHHRESAVPMDEDPKHRCFLFRYLNLCLLVFQ